MLSQTKLSPFGTSISLILWSGFTVAIVVWKLGITASVLLPIALAVMPYIILFVLSRDDFGKRRLWLILTLSILIGTYGVYQYLSFLMVNLSSLSNVAFWQVPLLQIVVSLTGFGLAFLWQVLIRQKRK